MSQSPREVGASAVPRPRGATWRDAARTRASSVRRCVTSDVNRPTLWWYCGAVTSARFDERQVLPPALFFGAGRSDDPRDVRRQVAAIQSGMTIGQVIGPLVGAIAAARLGFRASFVLGAAILFGCGALVRWGVPDRNDGAASGASAARPNWRDVFAVAGIVLGGSTQIFFLTSILPQLLSDLGVADDRTLEVGGLIIFASAVAAALGSVLASRLADLLPERRLISGLLVLSSIFIVALAPVRNVWAYGALRFLQVLCIAPVFPLAVARIAHSGGVAIGRGQSARLGAALVGPVL